MATTTLVVGGVAIYLYIKQKVDFKRDAASIILMEIRQAEKEIERIKTDGIKISSTVKKFLQPDQNYLTFLLSQLKKK